MTYVKPQGVDADAYTDSDYVAVDTSPGSNYRDGEIVATSAGYGVRYRALGDSDGAANAVFDIEILDALPLNDSDVRVSVRYDSDDEALTVDTNIYQSFTN